MNKQALIETLDLQPHQEGGYFRRTYGSELACESEVGSRLSMSSIYYALTDDSPIGFLHQNRSDIMHYHHAGGPIKYWLVDAQGNIETFLLGSDLSKGQRPQLMVKGGVWKASKLLEGEFGLISEAVTPGFVYEDCTLATTQTLEQWNAAIRAELKFMVLP